MSRRAQGYATIVAPDAPMIERDTFTCCHCQRVVFVHALDGSKIADDDQGGFCLRCMKQICGPCADVGECRPFEKQLVEMERGITRAVERRRALEKIGGS